MGEERGRNSGSKEHDRSNYLLLWRENVRIKNTFIVVVNKCLLSIYYMPHIPDRCWAYMGSMNTDPTSKNAQGPQKQTSN